MPLTVPPSLFPGCFDMECFYAHSAVIANKVLLFIFTPGSAEREGEGQLSVPE